MVAPPASGEWVYFMVNRADPDFTDDELQLCVQLLPVLVALYLRLTLTGDSPGLATVALTKREQAVLEYVRHPADFPRMSAHASTPGRHHHYPMLVHSRPRR